MRIKILLFILMLTFIGCDSDSEPENEIPEPEYDADLMWMMFDASVVQNAQPGDSIFFTIKVKNSYDPAHPENPDVEVNTKLKLYLEDVNADPGTIGTFGAEDLELGDLTVDKLVADKTQLIIKDFKLPTTGIFPQTIPPGNVFSKNSTQVTCKVYGILDYDDDAKERDENNNQHEATINSVSAEFTIVNPDKPNLQIKFYPGTSTISIPSTGGTVDTEWEIFNDSSTIIVGDFDVTLFLSEDDVLDTYDPQVVEFRVTEDFSSYSSKVVKIPLTLPYETWRDNGWNLFSAIEKYDPQVGNVNMTRELPPTGPKGYDFKVYPVISSTSKLIAFVDSKQTGEIEETNENDNYSYMFAGSNGELKSVANSSGSMDIELIDVDAYNYNSTTNSLKITLKYNASLNIQDNCSIGFYYSKDDTAQFGDYFIQRYWCQIQPGSNLTVNPFGLNFVWLPYPRPTPGSYRLVVVMDDIFKFNESDENNNWKVSTNNITVH